MLELLWPWVLVLAPLPLIYRALRKPAASTTRALRAPLLVSAAGVGASSSAGSWRKSFLLVALGVVWLSALLALARPIYIGEPVALPTNGRDILLAVDISGSMEREDMQLAGTSVNRLVAVKAVVGNFVTERTGDRLGLFSLAKKPIYKRH